MNVVNQSMGQFVPNGGGGDGGFLSRADAADGKHQTLEREGA